MPSTRLRSVVKVARQASGKTWAVTLWEPRQDGRVHELSKILAADIESRKLADQYAKAYRKGLVKPEASPTKPWAEAYLEGDVVVIRVPVSVLPDALKQNPRDDSYYGATITDVSGFARDVARELNREAEDGTTPIHLLFDSAMAEAIEQGSEHVELSEKQP